MRRDCKVLRHWASRTASLTLKPDCNTVRRMKNLRLLSIALLLGIPPASFAKDVVPDPPLDCEPCAE